MVKSLKVALGSLEGGCLRLHPSFGSSKVSPFGLRRGWWWNQDSGRGVFNKVKEPGSFLLFYFKDDLLDEQQLWFGLILSF